MTRADSNIGDLDLVQIIREHGEHPKNSGGIAGDQFLSRKRAISLKRCKMDQGYDDGLALSIRIPATKSAVNTTAEIQREKSDFQPNFYLASRK